MALTFLVPVAGLGGPLHQLSALLTDSWRLLKASIPPKEPTQAYNPLTVFYNKSRIHHRPLIHGGFPDPEDLWSGPISFYFSEDR